jgi:hypothetical protein
MMKMKRRFEVEVSSALVPVGALILASLAPLLQ